MFHYFQNYPPDDQHFDDFCHSQKSNACLISGISDYNVGCEWDLFKAPEPIIEQPLVTLDHMTSAMSMILCEENPISQQTHFTDFEPLEDEDFLSNLLYEYKDFLAKETSSPTEIPDFKHPVANNGTIVNEISHTFGKITKSVSSESLISVDGTLTRPGSMKFTEMELKNIHGMRRVVSEGHIKIKPQFICDQTRMQKLSRYRDKKTKRNFGRKIKYACRKALADGQPRIKGRFAKTEETEILKK